MLKITNRERKRFRGIGRHDIASCIHKDKWKKGPKVVLSGWVTRT